MSSQKRIRYQAIFKTDDQTDRIQYDAIASYHEGKTSSLSFQTQDGHIHISYDDHQICLKNNQSLLNLDLTKDIMNPYQVAYGTLYLRVSTILFEANHEHIRLKYYIYDQDELITTVYILITMKDC